MNCGWVRSNFIVQAADFAGMCLPSRDLSSTVGPSVWTETDRRRKVRAMSAEDLGIPGCEQVRRLGFAVVLSCALGMPFAAQGAADLVGHTATYSIDLGSAAGSSGIAGARGAVRYQFTDTCDGWAVENQTLLRIEFAEGGQSDTAWSYAAWEAKDGLSFRFRVRDVRDGEVTEELRGVASLSAADAGGTATFTLPSTFDVELPPGTLFPTTHLHDLFQAGRAGERRLSRTVFDGATRENPYEIHAFVRATDEEDLPALASVEGLGSVAAWRMRLAFYPIADPAEVPKFEIGVRYREDGIADRILQDFGDFQLDLTLEDLTLLPAPDC